MRPNWTLLTDEENAAFDDAMLEWQGVLNLMDWRVERGRRTPVANMAELKISHGARLAAYRTGNWGAAPKTRKSIRETALHESLHILLAELKYVIEQGCAAEIIESAEHRVITTIEKIIMEADRCKLTTQA